MANWFTGGRIFITMSAGLCGKGRSLPRLRVCVPVCFVKLKLLSRCQGDAYILLE